MGEKPDEIERDIEVRRERIGRNIRDLHHRVNDMADWRKQFERRPAPFLAVAFGVGFMASVALGNGHSARSSGRSAGNSRVASKALEAWESVQSALVGVIATKFTEILSEAIPGFNAEYRKNEAKNSGSYAL